MCKSKTEEDVEDLLWEFAEVKKNEDYTYIKMMYPKDPSVLYCSAFITCKDQDTVKLICSKLDGTHNRLGLQKF